MNTVSARIRPPTALFLGIFLACALGLAGCANQPVATEQAESGDTDTQVKPSSDAAAEETKAAHDPHPEARRLTFRYQATILPAAKEKGAEARRGPVDIFLPIAQSTPEQTVVSVDVASPVEGSFGTEETYGNRFWHARLDELPDEPMTVRVTYEIERAPLVKEDIEERAGRALSAQELEEHRLFLKANRRVPIDGKIVEAVIDDLELRADDTLAKRARKIYDHVVDTMEYKKVGTGWGNGDTHWACSKRYGNCTDFHALVTSLARHQQIPARFEIGFPIPTDRTEGEIGGYHCWVKLYLPELGWTPIDASEAKKHPEKREQFFGTQPTDRVQFTVGRDLELGQGHQTEPLNYFVYPHVEVGGELWGGVETTFSFVDVEAQRL